MAVETLTVLLDTRPWPCLSPAPTNPLLLGSVLRTQDLGHGAKLN